MDLVCDYTLTAAGHSTLVGVMLDGRGMYGRYETTGAVPMDLDMCGGHLGECGVYRWYEITSTLPSMNSPHEL